MKTRLSLILMAFGLVYTHGISPPVSKSLEERIALATHIVLGTVKSVDTGPKDGEKFGHYTSILTILIDEVLLGPDLKRAIEIQVYAVGPVESFRKEIDHGQFIYLLRPGKDGQPKIFCASYGWDLREPMDKQAEIETSIANKLKKEKEPNRAQ